MRCNKRVAKSGTSGSRPIISNETPASWTDADKRSSTIQLDDGLHWRKRRMRKAICPLVEYPIAQTAQKTGDMVNASDTTSRPNAATSFCHWEMPVPDLRTDASDIRYTKNPRLRETRSRSLPYDREASRSRTRGADPGSRPARSPPRPRSLAADMSVDRH